MEALPLRQRTTDAASFQSPLDSLRRRTIIRKSSNKHAGGP
jgi:hypothetical protein